MSSDQTVSSQAPASEPPSRWGRIALWSFLVGSGVVVATACWLFQTAVPVPELKPARSLYVVIKAGSFNDAWRDYLESQAATVGVAVASDGEPPAGTRLRWRRASSIVTEGILVDGIQWIALPRTPPKQVAK